MKIQYTNILHGIIIFSLIVSFIYIWQQNNKITELESIANEQGKEIIELNYINAVAKDNCKKIIRGYALTVHDTSTIISNLDDYYSNPEKMILDVSIIMSRAERSMDRKNELLEEMNIDVETLRAEINEIIINKGL